jgi:hypothetical protein
MVSALEMASILPVLRTTKGHTDRLDDLVGGERWLELVGQARDDGVLHQVRLVLLGRKRGAFQVGRAASLERQGQVGVDEEGRTAALTLGLDVLVELLDLVVRSILLERDDVLLVCESKKCQQGWVGPSPSLRAEPSGGWRRWEDVGGTDQTWSILIGRR